MPAIPRRSHRRVGDRFNNAVDGLIVVDLTRTEARVLSRYMGKVGYAQFMQYHRSNDIVTATSPDAGL